VARISIFGGTGYAGAAIAQEATWRQHQVTSFSRRLPEQPIDTVTYVVGSVLDEVVRSQALHEADVVVAAFAPRGDMAEQMRPAAASLAAESGTAGVRLGVVGGAGSLLTVEGGPRLIDVLELPPELKPEVLAVAGVLDDLRSSPVSLDWFYVSPGVGFGAHVPGEARGTYRVGGDVALRNEDGLTGIGGADFAAAFVEEIETPAHHRTRFTVAY
jgi:uncharacterized protein